MFTGVGEGQCSQGQKKTAQRPVLGHCDRWEWTRGAAKGAEEGSRSGHGVRNVSPRRVSSPVPCLRPFGAVGTLWLWALQAGRASPEWEVRQWRPGCTAMFWGPCFRRGAEMLGMGSKDGFSCCCLESGDSRTMRSSRNEMQPLVGVDVCSSTLESTDLKV